MSSSKDNLLPFLFISLFIHSVIILFIGAKDKNASITIMQRNPIIINLASSAAQYSQKEIAQQSKLKSNQESGQQKKSERNIQEDNNEVKMSAKSIEKTNVP